MWAVEEERQKVKLQIKQELGAKPETRNGWQKKVIPRLG